MEKVDAFVSNGYKRNLWKVVFNSGTVGFMVADTKSELENFYMKRNLLKNVKSITPVLFGVVKGENE